MVAHLCFFFFFVYHLVSGAFSIVYEALDTETKDNVAVKVVDQTKLKRDQVRTNKPCHHSGLTVLLLESEHSEGDPDHADTQASFGCADASLP